MQRLRLSKSDFIPEVTLFRVFGRSSQAYVYAILESTSILFVLRNITTRLE
jgi:hypothetical protein